MKRELIENNPILRLTFDFSLKIIAYTEDLEKLRRFPLGNQLFKSGTSIGANAMEAQNAESKPDFIHKLKIAAKEAEETQYWLMLCERAENYPDTANLLLELEEIHKVLGSILKSAKKNNPLSFFWASLMFFILNLVLNR